MKFHGDITKDGKLTFTGSRLWVANRIKELPEQEVTIEITKYRKPRSLSQNAYLHGVLIPCFREALNGVGYDEVKDDVQAKEILKQMFLKRSVINKETGEVLEYVQNTSDLTTEEMGKFYEEVWKFCAENLNYVIPSPGQQSSLILESF